jgi:hypothetical protein
VAYNAATGAQRWAKRYKVLGNSYVYSVAVSPAGGRVFITGTTDTGDGGFTPRWPTTRPPWPSCGPSATPAPATATSTRWRSAPPGDKVVVTGESWSSTGMDYATVAYNG